jgi:hypothetical protein
VSADDGWETVKKTEDGWETIRGPQLSPTKKVLSEVMKGMTQGGPAAAVVRGIASATPPLMALENEAITRGAYRAGGAVTDVASEKLGLPPEVAGGLGYATNVGLQAAPAFVSGHVAGKLAAPAFEATAKSLMRSAVKPTLQQIRKGEASIAIDTMLEKGFNPTKGGVEQMKTRIAALNDQIKSAIANSPETVNKAEVGKRLLDTLKKFENQVNPQADVSSIKNAWKAFRDHPLLAGKTEIPVQLAQDLKTGTYKQLAKKYGEIGSADIEAQKALARGLKEEIARKVPGIAALNAEESKLITTLNVAERRALMDMNKNPGGLIWLAANPAAAVGFMADKSPLFKSLLARMLYSGQEAIPKNVARSGALMYELGSMRSD